MKPRPTLSANVRWRIAAAGLLGAALALYGWRHRGGLPSAPGLPPAGELTNAGAILTLENIKVLEQSKVGYEVELALRNHSASTLAVVLPPSFLIENLPQVVAPGYAPEFFLRAGQAGHFAWTVGLGRGLPGVFGGIMTGIMAGDRRVTVRLQFADGRGRWYDERVLGRFIHGSFFIIAAPPPEPEASPRERQEKLHSS